MINLKELLLNNNQLKSFNGIMANLSTSLQVFDLSDNLIEIRQENELNDYINDLFGQFKHLKTLNLTNNEIELENMRNLLMNLLPGLVDLSV
jgi:hypothetical protein